MGTSCDKRKCEHRFICKFYPYHKDFQYNFCRADEYKDKGECICMSCPEWYLCKYAFDPYNYNSDCLAEK